MFCDFEIIQVIFSQALSDPKGTVLPGIRARSVDAMRSL
jgi:hypothetical protein